MKLLTTIIATILTSCALAPLPAADTLTGNTVIANSNYLIRIEGDIMTPLESNRLIEMTQMLPAPRQITILINSRGGSVSVGEQFVSAMQMVQTRGVQLQCVVVGYAASMAFNILNECDTRYSLSSSLLLFHPVKGNIPGMVRAKDLEELATLMNAIDLGILMRLRAKLKMSDEDLLNHYYQETMFTPAQLNEANGTEYIHVVTDIQGIPKLFDEPITRPQFPLPGNRAPIKK